MAARLLGLELHVLHASTEHELEAVFANFGELQAGGLVVSSEDFFNLRQVQIAELALRYAVPTVFQYRDFVAVGGLMSYGNNDT
jgi:putative tryptophan/tyrosine transport system substrate-binding protein